MKFYNKKIFFLFYFISYFLHNHHKCLSSMDPRGSGRNALNTLHKIRRHLNEPKTSKTANSIKMVMNRPTYSSSQLSIQVSELHADSNGRLEISCLSTIPGKVSPPDEMYADFKSYSVKSEYFIFDCDLFLSCRSDMLSEGNNFISLMLLLTHYENFYRI